MRTTFFARGRAEVSGRLRPVALLGASSDRVALAHAGAGPHRWIDGRTNGV